MKRLWISALLLAAQGVLQSSSSLDDLLRDYERQPETVAAPKAAKLSVPAAPSAGASDPWAALLEGNARFARGQSSRPHQGPLRRLALAKSQSPTVAVLACADSRVPPELIFDQGLGDLFVVRVAGNVAGPLERASLEYAVEHLHCSLLVVLGHERCGAVTASQAAVADPHSADGMSPELKALLKEIEPAVLGHAGPEGLDAAVRENAQRSAKRLLEQSAVLGAAVKAGHLQVHAARYDLDSSRVEPLD